MEEEKRYGFEKTSGYYYEHENGTVIWKPKIVVESAGGPNVYFDSPFVKRWWKAGGDR